MLLPQPVLVFSRDGQNRHTGMWRVGHQGQEVEKRMATYHGPWLPKPYVRASSEGRRSTQRQCCSQEPLNHSVPEEMLLPSLVFSLTSPSIQTKVLLWSPCLVLVHELSCIRRAEAAKFLCSRIMQDLQFRNERSGDYCTAAPCELGPLPRFLQEG